MGGSKEHMIMSLRVMTSAWKDSQMEVVEDFESRTHKAVSFVVERDKEVQEWNEQKMPQGASWLTVEAGCQEESQKKKAEKKRRKRRTVGRDKLGMKSLRKLLRASRRRQARMKMPRRPHKKEQLGKVSSNMGIARKLRNVGEEEDEVWQGWEQMEVQWDEERVGNEEEWKKVPCRQKS